MSDDSSVRVKKALITGAAKGIGQAIALHLASNGFDVAIQYRFSKKSADSVKQKALSQGVKAIVLQGDLTVPQEARVLVEKAANLLGGLSVVINCVGDYLEKPTSAIDFDEWQQMLDSNLNTTFYVTQTAIPYLKEAGWGRIINLTCAAAQNIVARHLNTAYMVAKTGVVIYTKSLAQELALFHITANMIAPGIAENSFDLNEMTHKLPMKRAATLQEINRAVWFLIEPGSDYVTGQTLEIAGGWNL